MYCSTDGGWFETDPHDRREHGQRGAEAAGNLLGLRIHVFVGEDQENQREEGNQRDDGAKLVLEEETRPIGCTGGIVPVGRFPQQVAGDCENRDADQKADDQRQVSLVELVLAKENNAVDLTANGHYPRQCGESRRRMAEDFWPCVACQSLVTSALGLLSLMTIPYDIDTFAAQR